MSEDDSFLPPFVPRPKPAPKREDLGNSPVDREIRGNIHREHARLSGVAADANQKAAHARERRAQILSNRSYKGQKARAAQEYERRKDQDRER